jgi:uncharacterized protein (DUF433 family)
MPIYCENPDITVQTPAFVRPTDIAHPNGGPTRPPDPEGFHSVTDDPMDIGKIALPDSLRKLSDGTIRVKGHRISLYLILDTIYSGGNIPELRSRFPTIAESQLWEVMEFYVRHHQEMWRYYRELRNKIQARVHEHRQTALSRTELLERAKLKGINLG